MKKILQTQSGNVITIEISDDGKATYTTGNRRTTFSLTDCQSIAYELDDSKIEITSEMLVATEEIEPWLWLVVTADFCCP
jgi:hypothetical protein